MSASRHSAQRLVPLALNEAYARFITYIKEYVHRRGPYWNSVLQYFSSTAVDRQTTCEELLNRIFAAKPSKPGELFKIIIDLGIYAKKAQDEQANGVFQNVKGYVSDTESCFAKMAHALRTCMVFHIKNSELKSVYEEELARLHNLYAEKSAAMTKKSKDEVSFKADVDEINKIKDELIFLQDQSMILECIKFEAIKPMSKEEVKKFQTLSPNTPLIPERPLFLQDYYVQYYYDSEITPYDSRVRAFLEILTKQREIFEKKQMSGPTIVTPSVLSPNFFPSEPAPSKEVNSEQDDESSDHDIGDNPALAALLGQKPPEPANPKNLAAVSKAFAKNMPPQPTTSASPSGITTPIENAVIEPSNGLQKLSMFHSAGSAVGSPRRPLNPPQVDALNPPPAPEPPASPGSP